MARYSLGIDIGGTFTDIVIYDTNTGRQASHKELTTHGEPARGVMTGIERVLAQQAIAPAEIGRVVHATTLFTNALIERKGAKTGLLTTRGFRDTLEIGRERKYELYDIKIIKPAPLVPRHLRLEIPERMTVDGRVHTALDEGQSLAATERLVRRRRGLAGHRVPAFLRQPGSRAALSGDHCPAVSRVWRCRPPSISRRRSASTSAHRRPSSMPTSSRWPSATCRR